MASMLAGHTEDELHEMLDEAKDDLFNLRFQSVIGQLDNNALLKLKKKEIARILTELRVREIAEAEQLEAEALAAALAAGTAGTSPAADAARASNKISEADDD